MTATGTRPAPTFVGRSAEIEDLSALVAGRRPERVGLVRGEPGIGKTELLHRVCERSPARAVRVAGSEAEAHLPFAVLADLVLPLRRSLAALPDVQREALEVSAALRAGRAGGSLAVCAAALGLLEAAGDAEPLLVVVDDLQWVDTPSEEVLLFVARRLRSPRVALLLATRDRGRTVPSARVVDLDGLGAEESRLLLGPLADRLPPVALDRLVEDLAGHPLALVENARHRTGGRAPRPGPALAALWTHALEGLPDAARTAVAVVAGAGSADAGVVDRVLADLGVSARDQRLAEQAGLIHTRGDRHVLRHPLLRPVVLGADATTTRRVHTALAARTTGARRAWHLAATADGADDAVAAQLAAAACSATQLGGHRSAGEAWARAAQLTTDRRHRAERFLAAAREFLLAGALDLAAGHAEAAAALDDDVRFAARVEVVRSRATAWLGDPRRAHADLVRAAERVAPVDAATAAGLYAEATMPAGMAGRVHAMLDLARRATALAPGSAGPARVCALVLGGRTREALALLDGLDADAVSGDLQVAAQLAQVAVHTERYEDADRRIDALLTTGRRHGVASVLAYAHAIRAELDCWRGRWPAARADAVEARQWAEELGEAGTAALATMILARLDAATGAVEDSRASTRRVLAAVGSHGIDCLQTYAPAVEGLAALVVGETDDAVDHLEVAHRRARADGLEASNVVAYGPDLAEALVRSGRGDRAREVLAWWETKTDLAFPVATAHRCRGLLAEDPDEAAACFARAREAHARCDQPFERARTLLAEAECLRRLRRPTAARPVARDAHAVFVALGARPWAARAESELAAAGVSSPRRAPAQAAWAALTPQEFQVARVVAEGRSNDEAAAALFVSRKTVENHLTRVYRKLGLRSRSELVRRFPDGAAATTEAGDPRLS
ncbi:LuxR C-terminal-related transcriptional regulator [Actinomycetospora lutea]|uniref:helix-turn-helix transcriptional regulator n=1 Tax=Actinomycetospora lutea TaxID=663604 RepID=UPI002366269C|nr:LuxR family transcriptional regulator [Actinomycetospora lutea]MDD7936942.1 LuxR C-terminal-related transcriptional regulator [Actinomycetospora lutea]